MKKLLVMIVVIVSVYAPLTSFAQKVGGGDLTFSPKDASRVVFSHDKHINGKGLKCTGCHYQIFQMAHGSSKMDMGKIRTGEFCGKCHNGQQAFTVTDQKNCTRCHVNRPG